MTSTYDRLVVHQCVFVQAAGVLG